MQPSQHPASHPGEEHAVAGAPPEETTRSEKQSAPAAKSGHRISRRCRPRRRGRLMRNAVPSEEVPPPLRKAEAGSGDPRVSTRRFTSSLRQLPVSGAARKRGRFVSESKYAVWPGGIHNIFCHTLVTTHNTKMVNQLFDLFPVHEQNSFCKIEPSATVPSSALEKATKWDPGFPGTPVNIPSSQTHPNLLIDRHLNSITFKSALKAELKWSQHCIRELETRRHLSQEKLKCLMRKLVAEKSLYRSCQHERMRMAVDNIKVQLLRERKSRRWMEFVNSRLTDELFKMKQSAKHLLQDYKAEKKARELKEMVCDELTKEVGEVKVEVERLKSELTKITQEVEEERRMLQLAELWREGRVQMKLNDAKLTLEEKYSHLRRLVAELDAFLMSRNVLSGTAENREAELLREAASSLGMNDIEFNYRLPSTSDDVSECEEIQSCEELGRNTELCYNENISPALDIYFTAPEFNGLYESQSQRLANIEINEDGQSGHGRETTSNGGKGFYQSPRDSHPTIIGESKNQEIAENWTNTGELADEGDLANMKAKEPCPPSGKNPCKDESSASYLQRPFPNSRENINLSLFDALSEEIHFEKAYEDMFLSEGLRQSSGGHGEWLCSGDSAVAGGTEKCSIYPPGIKKSSLMARILEERLGC